MAAVSHVFLTTYSATELIDQINTYLQQHYRLVRMSYQWKWGWWRWYTEYTAELTRGPQGSLRITVGPVTERKLPSRDVPRLTFRIGPVSTREVER